MTESESTPLPPELSIPLSGDYTVLSVDRSDVDDHTFVSVSVLYQDIGFSVLADHFDAVFAESESAIRRDSSTEETPSVSWSATDPIRSVAITGVPTDGIVAVGLSEEIPRR